MTTVFIRNIFKASNGLYYKSFIIVIYDRNNTAIVIYDCNDSTTVIYNGNNSTIVIYDRNDSTIGIYDRNDSCQYYKTTITA